jgi:hypothetical protein
VWASGAGAIPMTFTYSGTVHVSENESVFGEPASAVPINVALTYDTSLVTGPPDIIPRGTSLNGYTFADDWYGFNWAGITDLTASFGSKVWDTDDLIVQANEDLGFFADVVFNADIRSVSPSASFLTFADSDGLLQLGNGIVIGGLAVIDSSIVVSDFGAGTSAFGQDLQVRKVDSDLQDIGPQVRSVPENFSSWLMLCCSVGLLLFARWQEERKQARKFARIPVR